MMPDNKKHSRTASELCNLNFAEALELAINASGQTRNNVAFGMGWTPSKASRVFNANDEYWPNSSTLPALCAVLRNNILIQWQAAKYEQLMSGAYDLVGAQTPLDLYATQNRLAIAFGEFSKAVAQVAEGKADQSKLRRSVGKVMAEAQSVYAMPSIVINHLSFRAQ